MQLDVVQDGGSTEIGSFFVANYPPFSVWSPDHIPAALAALDTPALARQAVTAPLGLYLHIPFCRKRCKFCYYRIYTGKNSDDIETYLDTLVSEIALYANRPCFDGRQFEFAYFGGGTPSFLSSDQLRGLVERINRHWTWDSAREVTFECEPGTLRKGKLQTIKDIGTTRLSLGIEHFDDEILEANGRAHKSAEIWRAYQWAREVGFEQINLDLIAGMLGDTEDKWKAAVDKTLEMDPDSVTIYQMELPYNTVFSQESRDGGAAVAIADWATKRRWLGYAFDVFEQAGYVVSSAYTLVRPSVSSDFVYRDSLWHGADMVGTGVASFSHVDGVHFQNVDTWEPYIDGVGRGELPLARALPISDDQRLIREIVLQTKSGRLDAAYFRSKYGVEIAERFADEFATLIDEGFVTVEGDKVTLTRAGLLCADGLVPRFFEPQFRGIRYS